MLPSAASLATSLALALALVAATPLVSVRDTLVTLPIAKRINFTGAASLHARDVARARHLRSKAEARLAGRSFIEDAGIVGSIPVTNQAVSYVANVGPSYIAVHAVQITN